MPVGLLTGIFFMMSAAQARALASVAGYRVRDQDPHEFVTTHYLTTGKR
jgi:hypothetical protein